MVRKARPGDRKQSVDEVVLKPVSPARERRARFLVAFTVVALMVLALAGGFWLGHRDRIARAQLDQQLHLELTRVRDQLAETRQSLAVYKTDAQVDEQARIRLRKQIRELRDRTAELEEAVAFYGSVMAPAKNGEPLQVQRFELTPVDDKGRFRYQLVLVQSGNSRSYLAGQVRFRITGSRDGEPVVLDADDLLEEGSDLRFRFRYFQELAGTLTLPEGVKPATLEVIARSTGGRRSEATKSISW